ncbi:hypothetical protein D4764_0192050 [Takifugu flavidus]|uniref:Ig-like domain-containing protein n=1 Tax=Takifugu flavidus TaxID=433684 RepID=A0A5C6MHV4_9TELE|nr:hypothetical protein D4764_0192050 [Takifugu flavidus]
MNICLLFWILLPAAECGSHSLEFLSTGRVQPGSGLHFEQVTEFDGVVISHCDSGTQQEHFKPVLESHNLPGTCEVALNDAFGALKEISKFTNHTLYLRVFANPVNRTKALLKCHVTSTDKSVRSVSLTEDGAPKANWITVTGPLPSGDGSVILILTAEVPLIHPNIYGCVVQTEDRTITVMWDLRVFANPVDRTKALLKCHVTSTDKSVRSVSLTEDGAPKANWITVTGPLPSGDGSVILILTAEVPLIHTNIYGCVVQTEDRTITVMWDGNTLDGREILSTSVSWTQILGCVLFLCVLFLICTTALVLKCTSKYHYSKCNI